MTQSMVEYQFIRRQEIRADPSTIATGVHTAGLGSSGNVGHTNRTMDLSDVPNRSMPKPKSIDMLHYPMGKRERQIIQLALAGNDCGKIDAFLGLVDGEANSVCLKFGVEVHNG